MRSTGSLLLLLLLASTLLLACPSVRPDDDDAADDDDTPDDDDSAPDDDDSATGDDDDDSATGDDDDSATDDDDDSAAGDDDDSAVPPPTTTLVTIDDTSHELVLVDEATGAGTSIVELQSTQSMCSTIFTRAGNLYTSGAGQLWSVDPCTGSVSSIGTYAPTANICGLATRDLNDLYGLDNVSDQLVQINVTTAALTVVGPTGVDFNAHGMTWDQANDRFLVINSSDDTLYSIDVLTGAATVLTTLSQDFQTVGLELDPISGVLFACTGPDLLTVDPSTGAVTVLGPIWLDPSCDDLGATWIDSPCLEP